MSDPLRAEIREELRDLFVGERTLGDSFIPPILFVLTNAVWSIPVAAGVAVGAGIGVGVWRVSRGQQVIYAVGGVAAVAFAAFLALRTGRAEGYFLPGIVSALAWGVVSMLSILVRRPLAAWASWALRRWPLTWYWRDDVRPAYSTVSWLWVGYFAVRGSVSWWFFARGQPEALVVWKSITSWPTIIPLLVLSYRMGVTRRERLQGPNITEFTSGAEPPYAGAQRGF